MLNRRQFLSTGGLVLAGTALSSQTLFAAGKDSSGAYVCQRPPVDKRCFVSKAVEETIKTTKPKIKDAKLAWMFENCLPSTIDTTVLKHTAKGSDGRPDSFVITGDIHALWLRDSAAQVWPYLPLLKQDESLKNMVKGLVFRQAKCVCIDPYANAFNDGPKSYEQGNHWMKDDTAMKPELHERKWEIDSLCYPVRLAYHYWKATGDASVFSDEVWQKSTRLILQTFIEQQKKNGLGPYRFQRETKVQTDTMANKGWGNPVKPVGLIASAFRPSDDTTIFQFLIPSNCFAVTSLNQLAEIYTDVVGDKAFAKKCKDLADEVEAAIKEYGIIEHKKYGKVYAFEVDGYGNHLMMDDSNVPSLLALPYLGWCQPNDPIYLNTRKLILSLDNPYFFKGKAAEGIGGPHVGLDFIWPMSIILRAMTSTDDAEIAKCIKMLRDTDADTGFMHEGFHKDNPKNFTRPWFAWVNTLFGELLLKLVNEGKAHLLA